MKRTRGAEAHAFSGKTADDPDIDSGSWRAFSWVWQGKPLRKEREQFGVCRCEASAAARPPRRPVPAPGCAGWMESVRRCRDLGVRARQGNVSAKDSPRIRTGAAGWSLCSNLGICTCYDMIKQDGRSAVASCASFMVCPSSGLLVCWRGKLVLKPTDPDASRVPTLARAQRFHYCQPLHHCSHLRRQLLDLAVVSTRAFSAWHEP